MAWLRRTFTRALDELEEEGAGGFAGVAGLIVVAALVIAGGVYRVVADVL